MKRFFISLSVGTGLAVIIYLCLALPAYDSLLAHQPGRVPFNEATSFPPSFAFFAMLPYAIITLVIATLIAWVGQYLFKRKPEKSTS
jgi:ABC-type antimicrobial peptide transport system permease subunit